MVTAMNSSFASLPLSLLKNVGRAAARLLTCSAEHGAREICTLEREEAHRNTCSGGKYFHALWIFLSWSLPYASRLHLPLSLSLCRTYFSIFLSFLSFFLLRFSLFVFFQTLFLCSVADPHHVDADPACEFDPDPDPTFHFNPDPTFHFDPDPSFQIDSKPWKKCSNRLILFTFCLVIWKLMRIRIQLATLVRIRILPFSLMRIRICCTGLYAFFSLQYFLSKLFPGGRF